MINLEIPIELITQDSKDIQYNLLENKILIGLMGYRQSGKDSLGEVLVKRLSFKRISFADMLKKDLNEHMKVAVFNDLQDKGFEINLKQINFENPSNIEIKELLRPYMIWYGEEMKKINGIHHWTNRALSQINPEDKKIVITDVRRPNELTLFRNSRRYKEKCHLNRRVINMPKDSPYDDDIYDLNFDTLLLFVNQLENRDTDSLTKETIQLAFEDWLIDDTIEVDSRIKDEFYQKSHMLNHVKKLIENYPNYLI